MSPHIPFPVDLCPRSYASVSKSSNNDGDRHCCQSRQYYYNGEAESTSFLTREQPNSAVYRCRKTLPLCIVTSRLLNVFRNEYESSMDLDR